MQVYNLHAVFANGFQNTVIWNRFQVQYANMQQHSHNWRCFTLQFACGHSLVLHSHNTEIKLNMY